MICAVLNQSLCSCENNLNYHLLCTKHIKVSLFSIFALISSAHIQPYTETPSDQHFGIKTESAVSTLRCWQSANHWLHCSLQCPLSSPLFAFFRISSTLSNGETPLSCSPITSHDSLWYTVDHDWILLERLRVTFGVASFALSLFRSYLAGRSTFVVAGKALLLLMSSVGYHKDLSSDQYYSLHTQPNWHGSSPSTDFHSTSMPTIARFVDLVHSSLYPLCRPIFLFASTVLPSSSRMCFNRLQLNADKSRLRWCGVRQCVSSHSFLAVPSLLLVRPLNRSAPSATWVSSSTTTLEPQQHQPWSKNHVTVLCCLTCTASSSLTSIGYAINDCFHSLLVSVSFVNSRLDSWQLHTCRSSCLHVSSTTPPSQVKSSQVKLCRS